MGLGNYSMYDDSVGIRVIEYIFENNLEKDFMAIDLSANTINLFSYLNAETKKIVFVDTAKMGMNPGEHKIFKLDQVETQKNVGNFSTHEGDIIKMINFAKETNYPIPEIVFVGIEPETMKSDFGISETLSKNISNYALAAIGEITLS